MCPDAEIISNVTTRISEGGLDTVVYVQKEVFQSEARVFLDFAKEDLQGLDARGMANALSNAKRAIGNRVDTLLFAYGLWIRAKNRRWGYPTKVKKLRGMGVLAPRLLQTMITSPRNRLEHEYIIPENPDDVRGVIELAELYVEGSEKYLGNGFLYLASGPPSDEAIEFPDRELLVPTAGRYSILIDRGADTIRANVDNESGTVRLLEMSERELSDLMRTLYAQSQASGTDPVGPMPEGEFLERFL